MEPPLVFGRLDLDHVLCSQDKPNKTKTQFKLIGAEQALCAPAAKQFFKQKSINENHFLAPEIFQQETFDQQIDVYALGVLVFYLLSDGKMPHQNADKLSSFRKSQTDDMLSVITEGEDAEFFDEKAQGFLKDCLHKDPK